jgi:hypothetical protein
MCLLNRSPTLTVVARWTGGNQVFPRMFSTQATWKNVIDGKVWGMSATILAGVIVSA